MDRSGLSNKLASYAFLTILTEAGVDPNRVVCSETTMYHRRSENRKKEAERIKDNFRSNSFNTIHFDGKT